jgi:hypothetical protein
MVTRKGQGQDNDWKFFQQHPAIQAGEGSIVKIEKSRRGK